MENYEQYSSFVAAHKTSLAARRYALFKPPEPSFVPPKYRITIHIVFVKPSFRIVVNMGNPAVPDGSPSSEERSTSSPCSLLPKPMNAKQQCLDLRFFFLISSRNKRASSKFVQCRATPMKRLFLIIISLPVNVFPFSKVLKLLLNTIAWIERNVGIAHCSRVPKEPADFRKRRRINSISKLLFHCIIQTETKDGRKSSLRNNK
mmetsp:Transcript_21055/g.25513  ORF Transcript_21055/g.25513 Transcript_21055/m.25513 type:complete len:204 (-) Transcript_21055:21-632(-)